MALPIKRREARPAPPAAWSPVAELEEMHERIGRLLSGTLEDFGELGHGAWAPPVDIEETDDAWLVEAELPGVKQGDITIELQDSELAISGELKEKERKGILRRRTRRTGRFDYRVTLPGEFDPDSVEADLNRGVLTVRVPKPERAKPHRIESRAAEAQPSGGPRDRPPPAFIEPLSRRQRTRSPRRTGPLALRAR